MANSLLNVFSMDLVYFEQYAPVTSEIIQIIAATGWALLIGNMAFQAMLSMVSGIGFEGEDPKLLFTRTFVFSFLLVASRQVCAIGLGLTSTVIDLLQIPDAVNINTPDESFFGMFDGAWLLVVIVGIILIWQIVKFFFEVGERYVVLAVLTFMAPLAFGMGGSKNTEDIFKGWARMYGSMCVMMLMNVVFLKLLLSAMSSIPSGVGIIPWLIFVVALARVGRKVDDLVCRIGLNPARTGDPLGRGVPLALTMMVARNIGKSVAGAAAKNAPRNGGAHSGGQPKPGNSPRPGPAGPTGSPGGNAGTTSSHRNNSGGTYGTSQNSSQQSANNDTTNNGGTTATMGQAASATTNSMEQMAGSAAAHGSPSHRAPMDKNGRQDSSSQVGRMQGVQIQNSSIGQSRSASSTGASRKSPDINVEYENPQARPSGTASTQARSPSINSPNTQSKAAETTPTRPPIQRTPRGNFPQAPVGAGSAPHMSHTQQVNSTAVNNTQSQSTHNAGTSARPTVPPKTTGMSSPGSVNTQAAAQPSLQPLSGSRNAGAGIDRSTTPSGPTRPPIGHGSTVQNFSQESQNTSPSRNPVSAGTVSGSRNTVSENVSSVAQASSPSPGRNNAPQGTTPSQGRNGASAPQKPLPPIQGVDRGTSSVPSAGRDARPPIGSPETMTSSSPSRDEPKRPPIGHNRRPPQGG